MCVLWWDGVCIVVGLGVHMHSVVVLYVRCDVGPWLAGHQSFCHFCDVN